MAVLQAAFLQLHLASCQKAHVKTVTFLTLFSVFFFCLFLSFFLFSVFYFKTVEPGLHAVQLEWIDPNASAVYDYSMDADKAYYLTATSGFYPGEFGFFSRGRQTTNWIGAPALCS